MDMDPVVTGLPWHAHSATMLVVHMVWATRRRTPWLEARFDGMLADLLARKARRLDCALLAAGVAPDHVHVLLRHPPRVSIAQVAHRLKGSSARALHPALPPTDGHVWQVGYWAESVTPRDVAAVADYVRSQRAHHARRIDAEAWETTPP
jgi:putative transposase